MKNDRNALIDVKMNSNSVVKNESQKMWLITLTQLQCLKMQSCMNYTRYLDLRKYQTITKV